MEQALIDAFAKKQGYDHAVYLCQWRGYRCYEPCLSGSGTACTGLPLLILEDEQGNLRMSTPDEAMQQLDETE